MHAEEDDRGNDAAGFPEFGVRMIQMDRSSARSEIVIVSNRLPVQRTGRGRAAKWVSSPGGLVSALRPVLRDAAATWVGWLGDHNAAAEEFELDGVRNRPVPLSAAEVTAFYEGFSNRILWPLYHDAIRPPEYRGQWWRPYVECNRRFAAAAAESAAENGVVWVHDYHLQLVPAMLRAMRPDVRIGFFLHIPFPPQELFAQLPWRREILIGLLGSDVIGLQTKIGAQNLIQVARRFAGAGGEGNDVVFDDRHVRVDCFPISVDYQRFQELAAQEDAIARSQSFRARLGENRRIILGLDRLDYTKGIDLRLQAFRGLLRERRATREDAVFVQVAVPSREHVAEYKELRVTVERLVGEINGEFGDIGRTPVQYLHRAVDEPTLIALYRAADVMLVTPLRDGMNLVSKEYVASRVDEDGALVLSEFTGAAKELTSALLVNPHDVSALVETMDRALHMSPRERSNRMRAMREVVREHDVHAWAHSFLEALEHVHA